MRIAWLLLLLSYLFHCICSDVTTFAPVTHVLPSKPSATSGASSSGTKPTVKGDQDKLATIATSDPVQAQTQTNAAVITTGMAAAKPTADPHVSSQTHAPITNNLLSSHSSISRAPPSVTTVAVPATTIVTHKATVPAVMTTKVIVATTAGSSVIALSTNKAQTPEPAVPSKSSRTEPPVTLTGNPHHVDTSNIRKVFTDATTRQVMIQTTIPSKMSTGATEKTTVAVTRNEQTVSRAPEPTGNPGTPSTSPSPTKSDKTGSFVHGTQTGTTSLQTTTTAITTASTHPTTNAPTEPQRKVFQYSLNSRHEKQTDKELVEVCKRLMVNLLDGNCTLIWRDENGKVQFEYVEINGNVKTNLAMQYYEEISKKPTDNKTLIAILASCGALLIMIFIFAICASHHRRPYHENQQHLTEELHTVENGYHDNPTLEVTEVQPEMQEKKVALNGEFNDSWIVPIDNLLKEDIPDEEDTHL